MHVTPPVDHPAKVTLSECLDFQALAKLHQSHVLEAPTLHVSLTPTLFHHLLELSDRGKVPSWVLCLGGEPSQIPTQMVYAKFAYQFTNRHSLGVSFRQKTIDLQVHGPVVLGEFESIQLENLQRVSHLLAISLVSLYNFIEQA